MSTEVETPEVEKPATETTPVVAEREAPAEKPDDGAPVNPDAWEADAIEALTKGEPIPAADAKEPEAKAEDAPVEAAPETKAEEKTEPAGDAKPEAKPETPVEPEYEAIEDLSAEDNEVLKSTVRRDVPKAQRERLAQAIRGQKWADTVGLPIVKKLQEARIAPEQFDALVAQERYLSSLEGQPEKQAQYFRELAEKIHPTPKPAPIPPELISAVQNGHMTQERAQALADAEQRAKSPPPAPRPIQRQAPIAAPQDPVVVARAAVDAIAKEAATKHGKAVWDAMYPKVHARLVSGSKTAPAADWAGMARLIIAEEAANAIAAKRAAPVKKPIIATRPSTTQAAARSKGPMQINAMAASLIAGKPIPALVSA